MKKDTRKCICCYSRNMLKQRPKYKNHLTNSVFTLSKTIDLGPSEKVNVMKN